MRFITLPRTLLIVITLALTLLPGGVVQAASLGDTVEIKYYLKIHMDDSPLCAGRTYPVTVSPVAEGTAIDQGGTKHALNLYPSQQLGSVAIEANSYDAGIAKVTPARVISGWDVEDPLPNVANFALITGKPGSTSIFFEALLKGQYFGPSVPIKVVPCQYKVSMVYVGKAVSSAVVYKMATVELAGNGADFTGAGPVKWRYTIIQPPCRLTSTTPDTQATITGHLDSDQKKLTLNFKFSTATTHGTVSCFGRSGSTDAPWDFNALFSTATLPENGGTRSYQVGTGRVVVSVVPSTGATP